MSKYFTESLETVKESFQTDLTSGLDQQTVAENRNKYGFNKLDEKKGRTVLNMILDQFKNFLVLILIVASIASIAIGSVSDGIVILIIVALNAILGVVQENRANNALQALRDMSAPKTKVIRAGQTQVIESADVVPGDLIILEAGDYISSDIRLVESANLKVDESALTGESVSVEKCADTIPAENAPIGDRVNMAYMGTIVTYGRAMGIAVGTGMNTEIGKIASMLNEPDEETPLQKKLAGFGRVLGIIFIIVCIIIFAMGIYRGQNKMDVFMTAVSLAVAAIPEGLPAVVTVVLAVGMQRMISRHAIMKKLSAVETLGSTTVICTDKTGTLTQNKMTVLKIYDGFEIWDVSGTGYGFEGEVINGNKSIEEIDMLIKSMVLANDAEIVDGGVIGDPTEGSLIVAGAKAGYTKEELNEKYPRLNEVPFDSDRKLMSTEHNMDSKKILFTKGAPDVVLERSKYILENGNVREINDEDRKRISDANASFASSALRVLGFAYKELEDDLNIEEEEQELVFIGLTGMIDPPREEAKEAIKLCKKAGIRVVMITGDHITTAKAIGKEIGIIDTDAQAMEGHEIDSYDDESFKEVVANTNIFARVSPEHKVRIVDSAKSLGEIVAMTGDGVNDAPSLKKADIGIAMGITGTDVSKEAADMILTDDNFASIVDAVEEGRRIYSNIRKFVSFLLSCNIGEILVIFIAMLLGWGTPLFAIQLLWINLITDSLPAFALGLESKEENLMEREPRDPKEALVDRHMKVAIGFQSIGLAIAALTAFRVGPLLAVEGQDLHILARTFCFVTLIFGELMRAYSARSETVPIYKTNPFSNRMLNLSVIAATIMLLAVVYIFPLQKIFYTEALTLIQILAALGMATIPLIFGEVAKNFKR